MFLDKVGDLLFLAPPKCSHGLTMGLALHSGAKALAKTRTPPETLLCVTYHFCIIGRNLRFSGDGTLIDLAAMLDAHTNGVDDIPTEYFLSDVLARIYEYQLALEAALMEPVLNIEDSSATTFGEIARETLATIGRNAGY